MGTVAIISNKNKPNNGSRLLPHNYFTMLYRSALLVILFVAHLSTVLCDCHGGDCKPKCAKGDAYCQKKCNDPASYCKYWLGVPVCHGSDVPCTCNNMPPPQTTEKPGCPMGGDCKPKCAKGDASCQNKCNDPASYCKYWLDVPVCQGSDVTCTCHMPPPQTTEKTSCPMGGDCKPKCAKGDAYCQKKCN